MGFDVNFNNKPVIKGAQSTHDGGAGNLGYFERQEKENKSKNSSIFGETEGDSFNKGDLLDDDSDDFSISKLIAQLILSIKDWFKKVFGVK